MSTVNNSDTQFLTFFIPNDQLSSFLYRLQVSCLVLLMLISVLTILENTLVLVVTWREKSLHEPNKYFIVCLAIADLLVGMIVIPIRFYREIKPLIEGEAVPIRLCHFHIWIGIFAEATSINTLTFISFDRYLKVSKPLHYKSRMPTSTSLKVISIIFFISTVYATFSIMYVKGCYYHDKINGIFAVITGFILPTIIMMIMYTLIFRVVYKRNKMLRNGELGQTLNERTHRAAFAQDLKAIRMFVIVVGVFIICWGPLFIWLMLSLYQPELKYSIDRKVFSTMDTIILLLAKINSLCNPIIYACLDQKYKEAFKRVYQKLMRQTVSRRYEPPNAMELQNNNQQTRGKEPRKPEKKM